MDALFDFELADALELELFREDALLPQC